MLKEFEHTSKAMGTDYSLAVVCQEMDLAMAIFKIADQYIEEYESRFSRFLPESELTILNRNKKMIVSDIFLEVTKKAYQLFTKTHGIFNPLVQVARLGYSKDFMSLGSQEDLIDQSSYDIDFSTVILDEEKSMIILNDNQKLDYGGFLKGYLSELIAKKIKKDYPEVFGIIVNIGGDLHTEGLDCRGNKFVFNIYNPIKKDENNFVTLFNQSLATSGTYKRSWFKSNKRVHHILDETGNKNPETDIVSVSIIHQEGAYSEAYTKVFLSMNISKALELLNDKNIYYLLINKNGQILKNTL